MTYENSKYMRSCYRQFLNTEKLLDMADCYKRGSYAKATAFRLCEDLANSFGATTRYERGILHYNSITFTYVFNGWHEPSKRFIFVVITKSKTRYCYTDTLEISTRYEECEYVQNDNGENA